VPGWLVALSLVGGLAVLTAGAEALVRGATRLALLARISPLVVGLTVVAYGTSAPELVVSVGAAFAGTADIAVGNAVGSNVCNILLVLGASALAAPLAVARQLIRLEVPILIVISALFWAIASDGRLQWWDGLLLAGGAVVYTTWTIRRSRRDEAAAAQAAATAGAPPVPGTTPFAARTARAVVRGVVFVVAGLLLLVLGGSWFVEGAVALARALGVSDLVVGLTVVAAGTSMPEVVTSIVAAVRGERDIAIGNAVGSCVYNLLAVLGVATLVAAGGLRVAPALLAFDVPVMVAVAAAALPIFLTGYSIGRLEGLLFLGYYGAYLAFLVLSATRSDARPEFAAVMLEFVIPLTTLGIAVSLWRETQKRRARRRRPRP
jgi:cation:H+ antiporter